RGVPPTPRNPPGGPAGRLYIWHPPHQGPPGPMADQLSTLLTEDRHFPPPAGFAADATGTAATYERARTDRLAFWEDEARRLEWITPWDRVLDWTPPHARWFDGGVLNVSANCLERHIAGPRRNQAALIWEGEPGDTRVLTYWELHREVCRAANALRALGVGKGD